MTMLCPWRRRCRLIALQQANQVIAALRDAGIARVLVLGALWGLMMLTGFSAHAVRELFAAAGMNSCSSRRCCGARRRWPGT